MGRDGRGCERRGRKEWVGHSSRGRDGVRKKRNGERVLVCHGTNIVAEDLTMNIYCCIGQGALISPTKCRGRTGLVFWPHDLNFSANSAKKLNWCFGHKKCIFPLSLAAKQK